VNNRIFNVNGIGDEMLLMALELVFAQDGENTKARGWSFSKKHGLVLYWADSESFKAGDCKYNRLPDLSPSDVLPIVLAWLRSKEADQVELSGWDAKADIDGSTEKGWRVYCEDWGRVGGDCYAICAVKPAYLWYGK
jgi:hypothetical protein